MRTHIIRLNVFVASIVIGLASPAAGQVPHGWYPLRGGELPWNFDSPSDGPISVDSSSLDNSIWKIQVTLKEGHDTGRAWSSLGVMAGAKTPWEKSKLKIDLAQSPVLSFRMRCTQRDARNGKWWCACGLGIVNENGKVINLSINGVTPQTELGVWVTRTLELNPVYLKFPRSRLVGLKWVFACDSALGKASNTYRVEIADVVVRMQTREEKMNSARDPVWRQMRERRPLQTPNLTDRFWMGLWGGPQNLCYQSQEGTREVTGRDMLAHHVEVLIGMGCPGDWNFLETHKPQPPVEGISTLDRYGEHLTNWLADLCRPFDIKVIPNISGIAENADEDPKGFKANMDGLMSTFAREPLIVGWDGAEEADASHAREYLAAQFAIEERNRHQPMTAFLGDINTLHRFLHVYYVNCYPIRAEARKPLDVEATLRSAWRYDPPAVWSCLQGSAFSGGMVMPTAAETRLMNHVSLAGGAGSISYWRYGGMLPFGGPAEDDSLVDPFGNPSACWSEYGSDAPVCIRIGATTCLMRRDDKASGDLQKAQSSDAESLSCAVLRPRKLFDSEKFPDADPCTAKRLQQLAGVTVILVVNTDTKTAIRVRPNLMTVTGMKSFYTFPYGQPCPMVTIGKIRDPVELAPGGIAGWICGSATQARAANLAGDRALYLNCVRLPRYDIVVAKRWKADATGAEALLTKADAAFAEDNYAAALDLQAQAENEVQRALMAQSDYAAVTPKLAEIKAGLGQLLSRIRDARLEGRVKDGDVIAKGHGLAGNVSWLGTRYNRDILPVWVKGGTPQLCNEVEQLRREVLKLQAAADNELGPSPTSAKGTP